ncbi:hypothetical protein [Streptomyces sp. NPDC056527]|uniref:hypothetical protein n=1 Tax=Streptomyces sp. NPDC056527 TaxID=3345853 RepID=UPI0036862D1B
MVDVCCDRDVRLFLIGADPLDGLPDGSDLLRDPDRTASRLAMLRRADVARQAPRHFTPPG